MAFFKIRKCDVISTKYTAYPSYTFSMGGAGDLDANSFTSSIYTYIFNSTSVGASRVYSDIDGTPVTASYNLSGGLTFVSAVDSTSNEKRVINRLRSIYASSSFAKIYNYNSSSLYPSTFLTDDLYFLTVPSVLYGSEIKPGSLNIKFVSSGPQLFNDDLTDDSYGGLYSNTKLVGSIFYQHGIVYLNDSLLNGDIANYKTATVYFSGTNNIPVNVYHCRVPKGLLNFSNNPSYVTYFTASNRSEVSTKDPKTFVTGVGLYDENYKLIGIAKVSSPILNEEDTGLLFRLKINF